MIRSGLSNTISKPSDDIESGFKDSPSNIKMKYLTEKLSFFHSDLDNESQIRGDAFFSKLRKIEEKVSKLQITEEAKLNVTPTQHLKDSISKLQEQLANEHLSREIFSDKKAKEIKIVENNLILDINQEKQTRKETESKLAKIVDEKLFGLRLDLSKEKKIREESEETQLIEFADNIAKLQETLDVEMRTREDTYEKIIHMIGEDMQRCYNNLEVERKQREESHLVYEKAVEDMKNRIKQEVYKERKEREATEELLIKLLEETCRRVEGALNENGFYQRIRQTKQLF